MNTVDINEVRYDANGLIPAVVQSASSGQVLMVAYMNAESLAKTIATGDTWFYSRSRQELWHKGGTSGHLQHIEQIYVDCDEDTLLIEVEQIGAACHTGSESCFFRSLEGFTNKPAKANLAMLIRLRDEIKEKKLHPTEKSYTAYLFNAGIDKICKKIGEESAEVIIAAKNNIAADVISESADLLYHLSVLWEQAGIDVCDVVAKLEKRSQVKENKKDIGHQDKTF